MSALKKHWPWVPSLILAALMFMMAVPKLMSAPPPVALFGAIDTWLGVPSLFEPYLRYVVGVAECLSGLLLLIPARRVWGALLSLAIIVVALFFHLAGPLYPSGTVGEPAIFFMALLILALTLILLYLDRGKIPLLGKS